MNKKIITLFIVSGVLIASSAIGMVMIKTDEVPQDTQKIHRQDNQNLQRKNITETNQTA